MYAARRAVMRPGRVILVDTPKGVSHTLPELGKRVVTPPVGAGGRAGFMSDLRLTPRRTGGMCPPGMEALTILDMDSYDSTEREARGAACWVSGACLYR